ncbi:sporulation lipoprotein, YhcN/YlaJ family [Gracilibacillus ureilyticus]|uniref:Sporulation lipoprotein, YhcN/YlaJ family n=1 Tax=Gracilibacillus ureilyticus TaxID=531814 RepID=A0A1H9TJL6_9BACI|nr:YhcN/YlaJ family sporulation lipoprotein [Gracilibacillus ureilyticus]SER97247.1 sporulation lipoprotein, YhcN/YlaJ family [Gracilibacillus ureilyticus]
MKYFFIFLSLIIFITAGCQQNNNQSEQASPDNNGLVQVGNSNPEQLEPLDNQDKAQYLANLASKVPNVDNATALITNRGAIVSIDVKDDLDRSHVGSIKYSVLEALQHDPQGENAIIVADPDIYERMRGIGTKIQEGHPVEAFTEELANITGRLMPEIPVNEKQTKNIDENKKILDEQKEQELDQITDEQSNQQKDR